MATLPPRLEARFATAATSRGSSSTADILNAMSAIQNIVLETPSVVAYFYMLAYKKYVVPKEAELLDSVYRLFSKKVAYERAPIEATLPVGTFIDNQELFNAEKAASEELFAAYMLAVYEWESAYMPINWLSRIAQNFALYATATSYDLSLIVPQAISITGLTLPSNIKCVCQGNIARFLYLSTQVSPKGLVVPNDFILGSRVKSVTDTSIELEDAVSGATTETNSIDFYTKQFVYSSIDIDYSLQGPAFFQSLLNSGLQIDTTDADVKATIMALSLTLPTYTAKIDINPATEVRQAYKKIEDICGQCRVPFLVSMLVQKGFNMYDWYASANNPQILQKTVSDLMYSLQKRTAL